MRRVRSSVLPLVLALALGAASGARAGLTDDLPPATDAAALVGRYREDLDTLREARSLPLSASWIDARDVFLDEWQARLDGDALAPLWTAEGDAAASARVDATLLREAVRFGRERAAFDRARLSESLALAPFAADLVDLELARRRRESVAPRDAATRLDAARKAVDAVREKVERGAGKKAGEAGADAVVTTPAIAARLAGEIDGLHGALRRWFSDRDGFEPEFGWWCRKPWQELEGALDAYAKALREKVAGGADAIVGDPIGAEALAAELAHEFVPYSPAEILAIADRQMAWCEAEARKCAAEMGCGDDWKAALAKVKAASVAPGEQADLVARQAREAIEFVTSRDLVTVPDLCRQLWGLHMIPEGTQRTMPYAYYSGGDMGVAFPTDAMEHDRKLQSMRGNNVHFSRIVTPHELIPGHHLQMFQAARHRAWRGLFRTPFLVEGWSLWWEMRLWDLGWGASPEDRLGMLFWRMHRCARITVTMKFHLGEMTPAQMIDFLVERVGHERDGATAEVRRYVGGGYGPLYQAAYMLGGLQLRALHRELVGGGKMGERQFHDAVLREGPVPVRLIRAALTGEKLGPAGPSPWRFAD